MKDSRRVNSCAQALIKLISLGGETMRGKIYKTVMLVVALTLVFASGANAYNPAVEIPPGPPNTLPDYLGAPAKPHPTANSGVPQNPYLAPNPFNTIHVDAWMSDVYDIPGPLGHDPLVITSRLQDARTDPNSKVFQCSGGVFDPYGNLLTSCNGAGEGGVILVDAKTLEVLDYYPLTPNTTGGANAVASVYWVYDSHGGLTVVDGSDKLVTVFEAGTADHPVLEVPPGNEFDLSGVVLTGDKIAGIMLDWQGRIWFVTGGLGEDPAKVCVLKPAAYPNVKCETFGRDEETGQNEQIFNTFAMTKTAAYIVTSQMLHRVWAGSDDDPYIVWSEPYDTIKVKRPGQYELGSGTSPTILGEGKYVAITDNAEQLQVVVFRTEDKLDPNEDRIVCEVPVFEFEGAGAGALSNSLIGSRLALIAENTYGYEIFWQEKGLPPSAPGFERIDIDPDGKGCTKVWSNQEVASTVSGKLSTRNGLIYIYARKMENNVDVYYLTALDFRTGKVVWEKKVGSGYKFDHFYEALLLGPDETIFIGVYDGLVSIRDSK
jgi:hypothetical protein